VLLDALWRLCACGDWRSSAKQDALRNLQSQAKQTQRRMWVR